MIREHEITSVSKIVGNIVTGELGEAQVIAVGVASGDQIELVHPAVVDGVEDVQSTVTCIARQDVRHGTQGDDLAGRDGGAGGSVNAWKRAEIAIERPVFFDEKNEVLDRGEVRSSLILGGKFLRNRACPDCNQGRAKNGARESHATLPGRGL